MSLLAKLLYFNAAIIFVYAQNDGKYRPIGSVTKRPVNDGKYQPVNDGRYYPANDGKYQASNDGKYVHVGDKDRGQYSGGGGEYTGGGGQYAGSGSDGGQYTGNGGQYTGGFGQYSGSGGQNSAGSGQSSPKKEIKQTTAKPRPIPQVPSGGWKIIRDEKTEDTDGYHYLYETENRILAEEAGRIENLAPNEYGLRSKGFYQYIGDDGVLYRVDYVADNNGFVAQGDHIPKTPPAIQKLIALLATQT